MASILLELTLFAYEAFIGFAVIHARIFTLCIFLVKATAAL